MTNIEKVKEIVSLFADDVYATRTSISGTKVNELRFSNLKIDLQHLQSVLGLVFGDIFATMVNFPVLLFDERQIECKFTDDEFKILYQAMKLHGTETRKSGKSLYINHPIRTALNAKMRYKDTLLSSVMLLHDVIEDCDVNPPQLKNILSGMDLGFDADEIEEIVLVCWELTNRYTKVSYPNLNKADRTRMESQRLSMCSLLAMKGKSLDIADNTSDAHEMGKYGRTYVDFKRHTIRLFEMKHEDVFEWVKKDLDKIATTL